MPETPQPRAPVHISHSARETLTRCAKSYFLKYLAKAPKRPALWLAGGSAVHQVTEVYDLNVMAGGEKLNVKAAWDTCFDFQLFEAREREPNENIWAKSSAEPIEVWRTMGLGFVRSYIDWRERSPWEIWTTPDGEPAIELDVSGRLPGCPVEIKAYLDRVFWDPVFKKHWIVDLKSGKKPPKNADQFGTYSALLKVKYGLDVDMGVPFMNRKGTVGKPFDLTEYTPEFVGEIFGKAWEDVQGYLKSGQWPADLSDCFLCDVKAACAVIGGPLAPQYDPASPGHPSNTPSY
ncbi:RecB family exonuclease [Streptomyces himalayensis]|uniref:PD-(D/E)XK nuclease family protein n=1 Tax=Streptomyces himalayensis subsp. himalayensis TaxID=2756131 RepID=A0A7W0ID91_9ACTN|nr:PD-(D/E)XK nuclease family protein [Streptomyces himalayensis]MBA2951468.1 PD-(D/E)XK nuclease family protein [Streptomyces himalayensis subsp. himalayensis]